MIAVTVITIRMKLPGEFIIKYLVVQREQTLCYFILGLNRIDPIRINFSKVMGSSRLLILVLLRKKHSMRNK